MFTRRSQFVSGLRAELPILVGVAPFGMIYGVLALSAGLPPLQAQAMSAVVFAGSSQIVLVQLINVNAPFGVMIVTALAINLRHALYSASLAPYLQHLSRAWGMLLSYLLTDEAYAVGITYYESRVVPEAYSHYYYLGAGLALWSTWQLSTAAGVFLGAAAPAAWALDFTLALTFIALVIPNLRDRPMLAAALGAGLTAVPAYQLPYKLGLIVAAVVGVLSGLLVERLGRAVIRPMEEQAPQ